MPYSTHAHTYTTHTHTRNKQALERELAAADIAAEEQGGRAAAMEDHLRHVRREIAYTEARVRVCACARACCLFVCVPLGGGQRMGSWLWAGLSAG
jgi:hypothetical protein